MVKRYPYKNHTKNQTNPFAEDGNDLNDRRQSCAKRASTWLKNEPVFLDTETTGLDYDDEVIEVGIVGPDGDPLLNTLVKPTRPIPSDATAVHGITNDDVADAPTWDDLHGEFAEIVQDRTLVIYNAEYDLARVRVTARAHDRSMPEYGDVHCAMELYARWYGAWDDYHMNYTWQKLEVAAQEFNADFGDNQHRASADADVTRQVLEAMADAI